MGTALDQFNDKWEDKRRAKRKEWAANLISEINSMNVDSLDFEQFKWMIDNKEKIIGNKHLINLLR